MKCCIVWTLSILLLLGGGFALAGGDGDRDCGGKCPGACGAAAGAAGEEGAAGETGDEATPEEEPVPVRLKAVTEDEGKEVRVQLGGDWDSLTPEAKKMLLERLSGMVDGQALKKILDGLVEGKGEVRVQSFGPVRVASPDGPKVVALKKACPECAKADGPCAKCAAKKPCADCAAKDGSCEKCRMKKALGVFLKEGADAETFEFELEGLPEVVKKQIRVYMEPGAVMRGRVLGPDGGRVFRAVPSGPGGGCPMCGGHGPRMGPGPRGMRTGPGGGRGDIGRQLVGALNALRAEISALRSEMRAGHGDPSVPRRWRFEGKDGAHGGMIVIPHGEAGGKSGAAPKAPTGPSIGLGGAAGRIRLGPPAKKAEDLSKEVERLKSDLETLKSQMGRLLKTLEKKAEAGEK